MTVGVLHAQGRIAPSLVPLGVVDLGLGILFAMAFVKTAGAAWRG